MKDLLSAGSFLKRWKFPSWNRLKLEARHLCQVCQVDVLFQAAEPSSAAFPVVLVENWIENGTIVNLFADMECWCGK